MTASRWRELPALTPPAAVLAILATPAGVWLGGSDGAVRFGGSSGRSPVTAVAGLARTGAYLLAGGADGIARSADDGRTWSRAAVGGVPAPVSALVSLPGGDAVAGTLGGGALRSGDQGRTWEPASFGLRTDDVTALAVTPDGRVYAGTPAGLFRSTNSGRAWRAVPGLAGVSVEALATGPGGGVLAGLDDGRLVVPDERSAADEYLIATTATGIVRWTAGRAVGVYDRPALCVTAQDGVLFAGTAGGLLTSADEGRTWSARPDAARGDIHRVLAGPGVLHAAGSRTGLFTLTGDRWTRDDEAPFPLFTVDLAGDGGLVAAGPDGVFRRAPGDAHWAPVAKPRGPVHVLAFGPSATGAAATAVGTILHSADDGRSWHEQPAPFGAEPPGVVQPVASGTIAVQYDHRHGVGHLWTGGPAGWIRGPRVQTPWADAAVLADPELVGLGRFLYGRDASGRWVRRAELSGGIRQLTGTGRNAVALTTDGVWRRGPEAEWVRLEGEPPVGVAVGDDALYAVLGDGRVSRRALTGSEPGRA